MDTVEDIKTAILPLSPADRARAAEWLDHLGRFELEVREPAVPYGARLQPALLSVEEYLQLEEHSEVRHEYIHGVLYAISGASERHNLISCNLLAAIHGHLRGKPCRAYMADFKVRLEIDHGDIFYYPDVMVACRREGVETCYLRPELRARTRHPRGPLDQRALRTGHRRGPMPWGHGPSPSPWKRVSRRLAGGTRPGLCCAPRWCFVATADSAF